MSRDDRPRWPRRPPDPALVNARLQAHHAAQLLASFAGALLEPRDDDGHRSLCWDDRSLRLSTGSLERTDAPLTVHLDPAALVLELEGAADGARGRWALTGLTLADARARLEDAVSSAVGRRVELPPPEYEVPDHPVAHGRPFEADPEAGPEFAAWFSAAARTLAPWAARADAAPLRCWPHHFDLATLVTLPGTDAEGRRRTVGCGMTPGDDARPAPYGYVTPWPYPWTAPRPSLRHGEWHVDGWLGAVLPGPAWIGAGGPAVAEAFFDGAFRAAADLHRCAD